MASWLLGHVFVIACLYGIVASVLFWHCSRLHNSLAYGLYVFGLLGLMAITGQQSMAGGGPGALLGLILGLLASVFILLCNAPALYFSMEHFLTKLGREALGLNQMVFRKSYDRAKGAEARGDFEQAAALYRHELEYDPRDTTARRLLAEALLRCGRPEEAVEELQQILELLRKGESEERMATLFRLAEVSDEELGDPHRARQFYDRVVAEDPESKHAGYARSRLGGGDPSEAPTDS